MATSGLSALLAMTSSMQILGCYKVCLFLPADRTSAARTRARDGPCASQEPGGCKGAQARARPLPWAGRLRRCVTYVPRVGRSKPRTTTSLEGGLSPHTLHSFQGRALERVQSGVVCQACPKMRSPRRFAPRNDPQQNTWHASLCAARIPEGLCERAFRLRSEPAPDRPANPPRPQCPRCT